MFGEIKVKIGSVVYDTLDFLKTTIFGSEDLENSKLIVVLSLYFILSYTNKNKSVNYCSCNV